jgi:hypothetical protein
VFPNTIWEQEGREKSMINLDNYLNQLFIMKNPGAFLSGVLKN